MIILNRTIISRGEAIIIKKKFEFGLLFLMFFSLVGCAKTKDDVKNVSESPKKQLISAVEVEKNFKAKAQDALVEITESTFTKAYQEHRKYLTVTVSTDTTEPIEEIELICLLLSNNNDENNNQIESYLTLKTSESTGATVNENETKYVFELKQDLELIDDISPLIKSYQTGTKQTWENSYYLDFSKEIKSY